MKNDHTDEIHIDESFKSLVKILQARKNKTVLSRNDVKSLRKAGNRIYREKIAIVYLVMRNKVEGVPQYKTDKEYFEQFVNDLVSTDTANTRRLKNAGFIQERTGLPIGSTSDSAMRVLERWIKRTKLQYDQTEQDENLRSIVDTALDNADGKPSKITAKKITQAIKALGFKPANDTISADSTTTPHSGSKPKPPASVDDPPEPPLADDDNWDAESSDSDEDDIEQFKAGIQKLSLSWLDLIKRSGTDTRRAQVKAAKSFFRQQIELFKAI